jgi:membrane-associated phospholipid phosphatase
MKRTDAASTIWHGSIPRVDRGRPLGGATLLAVGVAIATVIGLAVAVALHPEPLPGEVSSIRRWQRLAEPIPTLAEWVRVSTSTQATLVVIAVPAWWAITRHRGAGALAVAILLVTMLVAQPVIKEVIDRPRPTEAQVDVRAPYTSKSFPSGHSMSTTVAWGTAAIVAARRGRPVLAGVLCAPIALTAVASQVQGVHWPSDALAGTLIGGVAAVVAAAVLLREETKAPKHPASDV